MTGFTNSEEAAVGSPRWCLPGRGYSWPTAGATSPQPDSGGPRRDRRPAHHPARIRLVRVRSCSLAEAAGLIQRHAAPGAESPARCATQTPPWVPACAGTTVLNRSALRRCALQVRGPGRPNGLTRRAGTTAEPAHVWRSAPRPSLWRYVTPCRHVSAIQNPRPKFVSRATRGTGVCASADAAPKTA